MATRSETSDSAGDAAPPSVTGQAAAPQLRALTWPLSGRPRRSPWRLPAAAGAALMTVAHLPVLEEHLSEAPPIGVGFALLAVAGIVLAALLLVADARSVWISAAVVSVLALAGYVLSRTVGLPQIHDDIGRWADPLGIFALVGEGLMLVCAALTAMTTGGGRGGTGARGPVSR